VTPSITLWPRTGGSRIVGQASTASLRRTDEAQMEVGPLKSRTPLRTGYWTVPFSKAAAHQGKLRLLNSPQLFLSSANLTDIGVSLKSTPPIRKTGSSQYGYTIKTGYCGSPVTSWSRDFYPKRKASTGNRKGAELTYSRRSMTSLIYKTVRSPVQRAGY